MRITLATCAARTVWPRWLTCVGRKRCWPRNAASTGPGGRVTYVTEGQLRALHRKLSDEQPPYRLVVPYRSFKRKDATPLVAGEVATLVFDLLPTSYLFQRRHRIRLVLAGADASHFANPAGEPPTVQVYRNRLQPSHIDLPVVL